MEKVYDPYNEPGFEDNFSWPEGVFVMAISAMKDHPQSKYVALMFDIAEGPYAGFFEKADTGRSDYWKQHWLCLSYKNESARNRLRQFFEVLNVSNPGFNASEEWCRICDNGAEDFSSFIGKKFGAELGIEEWTDYAGKVNYTDKVKARTYAQYVRDGRFIGGRYD